jgi:mannose-1-phosphate guanylyltransferase
MERKLEKFCPAFQHKPPLNKEPDPTTTVSVRWRAEPMKGSIDMIQETQAPVRCGIVLAGGEGKRLKRFIYHLRASQVPKQYVNFIGTRSMLEHTFDRAQKLIPRERLFTVAGQDHLQYREARRQLLERPLHTVVLQPMNRETGPGVLLPLMQIYKRYPQSIVALFPSDHFILEEERFIAYVELAFQVVQRDPSRIVVLGIKPNQPEAEYGYILPNGKLGGLSSLDIHGVESFIEKPERHTAMELASRGALWNSMVMVFETKTFLSLIALVAPALLRPFQRIYRAIGTSAETVVVEDCYRDMKQSNFSKELLEPFAVEQRAHLAVIPVNGVLWSDWGSAPRIMKILQETGYIERLYRTIDSATPDHKGNFDARLSNESLA